MNAVKEKEQRKNRTISATEKKRVKRKIQESTKEERK